MADIKPTAFEFTHPTWSKGHSRLTKRPVPDMGVGVPYVYTPLYTLEQAREVFAQEIINPDYASEIKADMRWLNENHGAKTHVPSGLLPGQTCLRVIEIIEYCQLEIQKLRSEQGPKVGDGTPDAALAIGEHAFRAGFSAAEEVLGAHGSDHLLSAIERAWSDYDPPEHIKELS